MDEQKKAVETTSDAAKEQPVKNEESAAGSDSNLIDIIADLDAKLEKVTQEKNNYKEGLLKAKGKTDDFEDEDIDAKVKRLVQEQLTSSEIAQIQSKKDALIKQMAKELEEAKLTIKTRSEIGTSTVGGGVDTSRPSSPQYFSSDQIAALKAKGWSDEKINRLIENAKKKL